MTDKDKTLILEPFGNKVIISKLERPGMNAILYFGGNAEDVSLGLKSLSELLPQHSIYMLHYRGYGGSEGRPDEDGIYKDALALYGVVGPKYKNISVIGRSLGSGIATHLASKREVKKLILITPYSSMTDLAHDKFPVFPANILLKNKFDSCSYAFHVNSEVEIYMAENDNVVPHWSTQELHRCFKAGKSFIRKIHGTNHNTITGSLEYQNLLRMTFRHDL